MVKTARNLTVLGLGLSISAAVGWLLLRESKRDKETASVTIKSYTRPTEQDAAPHIVLPLHELEADETPSAESGDDLTQIRDIGPRFAAALRAVGITRFADLADYTPESLAEKLSSQIRVREQRIRDNDWIGQAASLARR